MCPASTPQTSIDANETPPRPSGGSAREGVRVADRRGPAAREAMPPQQRIKNRRTLYLDAHPSYFTSSDHELADPLLYDRCIRRFQTAAERDADARRRDYGDALEAELRRCDAEAACLKGKMTAAWGPARIPPAAVPPAAALNDGDPTTREEGLARWKYVITQRFLAGEDYDFDYTRVDENDEWDWVERREQEEAWFDDEEPSWAEGRGTGSDTGVQDF